MSEAATTPRKLSLREGLRVLTWLMPPATKRAMRLSVVFAFLLASLEFLAVVLLYPVFGFLAQGAQPGSSFTLPVFGLSVEESDARLLAVLALALMILRSVLSLVYRRWWLGKTAEAEWSVSNRMLTMYAYAPYSFHLYRNSAELMARAVANVNIACQSGLVGAVGAIADGLLAAGLAAALIAADPTAGLVVCSYILVLAIVYISATRGITQRVSDRLNSQVAIVYRRVDVLLKGIRELTVFGLRGPYLQRVAEARGAMVQSSKRVSLLQEVPRVSLEVVLYSTVLIALVLLLSGGSADKALPLVALYILAGLRIMPAIARMLGGVAQARTGGAIALDLQSELRTLEDQATTLPEDRPVSAIRSTLELEGVCFRYPGYDKLVLSDVSLKIPFGQYVGIIGESGSGKTTLTSLVLGLLEPVQGSIRYGNDLLASNDPSWFRKIAVVPQDVYLTDESLADNIRAGSDRDDGWLLECTTAAGLTALVEELPDGFDTPMLEAGARLSAGQRQRVGLARAFYRRPEILVLDEPTSALDSVTEQTVLASLEDARGRMTILAVAHRTDTLLTADTVVRLTAGKISEVGPPSRILATHTTEISP